MTISAQSGLIAQNNFFDKQVASQNLSNYLLLYKGDFAYNKSYSNGYPYGAVKRLEKFNCGVVSSLYIAFKPTHVLPNFLAEYYETTKWYVEIYKRAAEGARNHGLLNISATDFFNSDISLPKGEDEQEKIGQLFQSLDKTITLHEEKQHQLERLKKALLQKMFADETGYPALRFKGFTEKWEQVEFGKLGIISRGLTYRPNDVTDKNGVRVLRSSNIYEDSFVLNDNDVFVNSSVVNVPNLKNGDILVTSANGSSRLVGKHAIIKGLSSKTVHGGFMLAIRPATNSYFLNSLMSTSWYDNFISTFVSGGNGSIGNLKKSDLEQQSIFIPLNKEQNKIGDVFYNLDKTITLHDKKIQYLKQLKRGLLQKMFV